MKSTASLNRIPSKSRISRVLDNDAMLGDNGDLICPLTKRIPDDGVAALDGHVYSKRALLEYLETEPDADEYSPLGYPWITPDAPFIPKCNVLTRILKASQELADDENATCPLCHMQPIKAQVKYAMRRREVTQLLKFVQQVADADVTDPFVLDEIKHLANTLLKDGPDIAIHSTRMEALPSHRSHHDGANRRPKTSRKISKSHMTITSPLNSDFDDASSRTSPLQKGRTLRSDDGQSKSGLPSPVGGLLNYGGVLSSLQKAGKNVGKSFNGSAKLFAPSSKSKTSNNLSPKIGESDFSMSRDHSQISDNATEPSVRRSSRHSSNAGPGFGKQEKKILSSSSKDFEEELRDQSSSDNRVIGFNS